MLKKTMGLKNSLIIKRLMQKYNENVTQQNFERH